MDNLIFSLNAVAPVFVIVFLGAFLKRKGITDDKFNSMATNMVFKVALPVLLFRDVASADVSNVFDIRLILFVLIGTVLQLSAFWIIGSVFVKERPSLGAFVQGAFRGNFAFIGLPLAYNLFGQQGLAKCAVLLSFTIPLYNVLATILLTVTSPNADSSNIEGIIKSIIKNPLIISIVLALPFSYFHIQLPQIASKSIEYLSGIALPMALLSMGGTFSFTAVKRCVNLSLAAAFLKIVLSPLVFTLLAFYMGFRGYSLGSVFIVFGAPSAVTSYVMAKAMDSDSELAASIVLMSTLGSIFTLFAGIFIFKSMGIM